MQTYTIGEAITLVSRQIGRAVEDDYAAYLANIAQNVIWNKYDWRETLAALPPFYLVPGLQNYGAPAAVVPADFLGLREAYLVNTSSQPAPRRELKVRRDLRATEVQDLPSEISYEPSLRKFRVWPRVPFGLGPTDWMVDGTYKQRPTKITAANLAVSLIPWDDLYLQVYVAALKWAAWDVASDPRAGAIQMQNGMSVYTGQLGVMHDAIDGMASAEGLNLGDPTIAPSEPLVGGTYSYGSILGGW